MIDLREDKIKEDISKFFGNLTPRDANRIPLFLAEIEIEWRKLPDLRFGQFMFCFFSEYGDPFFLEEEAFLSEFKKYVKKISTKK